MSFKVLERFINANEIKWSDATTIAYKADIRLFLETMHDIKNIEDETLLLQSISNDDIEDWIDSTKGKYSLKSINRKITALSLFFKYITVNKKIIKENVMDGIEQIKINEKKRDEAPWSPVKEKEILTVEELLKVLEFKYEKGVFDKAEFDMCIARDKFLLAFEATTGARVSEAINITFDMIDEVKGGYMVNITTTKTNQAKRVPIANKCLKYYEDYMIYRKDFSKAKDNKYLIVSANGNQMTGNKCNENINKLLTKVGLTEKHITNHSNRKMFRTYAMIKGGQESLIKIIGGWKLDIIADIYTKDGTHLDEAKIKACDLI